jgi:putative redox protein
MTVPLIVQESRPAGPGAQNPGQQHPQPPYCQDIDTGKHRFQADLPSEAGGSDRGPAPLELLAASLGACTSMTVRMYAERKQWPLTHVRVTLRWEDAQAADGTPRRRIVRDIHLEGPLTADARLRLLDIAARCPVAKLLASGVLLENHLEP